MKERTKRLKGEILQRGEEGRISEGGQRVGEGRLQERARGLKLEKLVGKEGIVETGKELEGKEL